MEFKRFTYFFLFCIPFSILGQERESRSDIISYKAFCRLLTDKQGNGEVTRGTAASADIDSERVHPAMLKNISSAFVQEHLRNANYLEALSLARDNDKQEYKKFVQQLKNYAQASGDVTRTVSTGGSVVFREPLEEEGEISLPSSMTSSASFFLDLEDMEEEKKFDPKIAKSEVMLVAQMVKILEKKVEQDQKNAEEDALIANENLKLAREAKASNRAWRWINCGSTCAALGCTTLWAAANLAWTVVNSMDTAE